MSFILDALKKVDAKKRFESEAAAGELARSMAARERRGRELFLMGSVAFASAAVTAGALVFLSMRSGSATPPPAAEAPPAASPAPSVRSEASVVSEVPVQQVVPPTTAPKRQVAPVPPRPETPREPVAAAAVLDLEEPADDAGLVEQAPAPAVRLVGRRKAAEASDAPRPATEPSPPTPPADRPALVLQGTSILDGRPVAVISDRRVFEGDFIEGARVLRIEEGAVTLELDGERFNLTF